MIYRFFNKINLLGKFSILSFILLGALAFILSWIIQQQLENYALQIVADEAVVQVVSHIDKYVTAADFPGPIHPDRALQLDELMREYIFVGDNIVRVKIWNRAGVVIYSDVKELVGQQFPLDTEIEQAFQGKLAFRISSLDREENVAERGQFSRLFEVYVPIVPADSSQVEGVCEIYKTLSGTDHLIDSMQRIVWASTGIGFLVLYLSLFMLVRSASRELVQRNDENARLYREAKQQLDKLETAENKIEQNYQIQTALNALLQTALLDIPLETQLQENLEHIISLPWLSLEAKGCILLVEEDSKILVMKAQSGLSAPVLEMCQQVPFGRCLCGRAAVAKEVIFCAGIDDRHEIQYEGMSPHGHYCIPILSGEKVLGVMTLYVGSGHQHSDKEEEFLSTAANVIASIVERQHTNNELEQTVDKLRNILGGTIQIISSTTEMRDPYTAGHQRRVADLARAIAKEIGLSSEKIEGIRIAGIIHDLGKISIPAEILSKPGRISDLEFALIKTHPQVGYEIIKSSFPEPIPQIVLQHHERMNGSGYPVGLAGSDILLEARVLAVADVVEAMATHRPYRASHGIEATLEEIIRNRGILYDPQVVDACVTLFKKGYQLKPG
jgi:HD-GYP domain-containing protein (c-di-GMP phosphodiesterase class II)